MRTMSIRELRAALSSVDDIFHDSGEVIVTRHGRPIAKLCPLNPLRTAPSHADLRATMPRMSTPSEALVRADREQRHDDPSHGDQGRGN